MVESVKKRDGRIVDFDHKRIENAILKAFSSKDISYDQKILDDILERLEKFASSNIPDVESIQNIVEEEIAKHGYFDVAKAYILYRNKQAEQRKERSRELIKKVKERNIRIRKRDGSLENFDPLEMLEFLRNCCSDITEELDFDEFVEETETYLYDNISSKEINQALVLVARSRIENDKKYSSIASKILLNDLYREVIGLYEFENGFENKCIGEFRSAIKRGVEEKRYCSELLDFDLNLICEALAPERDSLLEYLGAQTLYDRYFIRDYDQKILEIPQFFWMRVAMGLAINEKEKNAKAVEFYNLMSTLSYLPSTPTLFHSGTNHPQMSSCYLLTSKDDLKNIFKTFGDVAELAKWSGGIGIDWTPVRGTGALIKSTNVQSQGVIPFLKILDSTTASINRSGKRRGATCAYMEVWHYDIEDFLELRKNTGDERRRTHDLNTAVWIPDLFMKRVRENGNWTLFSPDETLELHNTYGAEFEKKYLEYEAACERGNIKLFTKIPALKLWRKIITMLYETGHPWITFKDSCNIRSPQDHAGVINSSNLCTEITLNTSGNEFAVCNLGSVNLSRHVKEGQIDKEKLAGTVNTAIRMLDNVIDINFYPVPETENSNLKHRPIGLGMMGLQDALCMCDLNFDSSAAVNFSDTLTEFISYHAILASSELAREKGSYPSYEGSKWDRNIFPVDSLKLLEEQRGLEVEVDKNVSLDWDKVREQVKRYGMRNSNCMAIAPTATIANVAGCFPSIEPIYKNMYVKSNISGEFTIINQYLIDDLKKLGLWNREMCDRIKYFDGSVLSFDEIPEPLREKYRNAFEIDPMWILKHASVRGKWIDQSQSLNIFTDSQSGRFISNIYMKAWKMGLKTTYYLRTTAASSVEKSTVDINKKYTGGDGQNGQSGSYSSCELDEGCEACQ